METDTSLTMAGLEAEGEVLSTEVERLGDKIRSVQAQIGRVIFGQSSNEKANKPMVFHNVRVKKQPGKTRLL